MYNFEVFYKESQKMDPKSSSNQDTLHQRNE